MEGTHPILESPRRWATVLVLACIVAGLQTALLVTFAGADWLTAAADSVLTIGLFCCLAYLSWFVLGFVSMVQTNVFVSLVALLFWLLASFAVQEWLKWFFDCAYSPFIETLPFRLVYGGLAWIIVVLWYQLEIIRQTSVEMEERKEKQETLIEAGTESKPETTDECLDRITIKDGSKIHLVKTDELIYIQACGDYVTLVTPCGQYVKELTMKYLESHLPASAFVRVHRSTIVNVTQISRVELFGKENYRLLLKSGERLRVSLSGYRLLKERLEL